MQPDTFHDAAQPQPSGANNTPATHNTHVPVVGLGASAGGLRALQQFFQAMPPDSGMAFVVIMHLSLEHEPHAAQILQQSAAMPVTQVRKPVPLEPNHVYVLPPTQHLAMEDGQIVLRKPQRPRGQHMAIDLFFRTLAETHTTHAACIVLSGADGAVGIKRVKETGGVAFAQDPADAEYDGMPRNAINTGLIDWVLPVAEMPNRLIALWRNAEQIALPPAAETPVVDESQTAENALRDVFALVRTRTGHDFTHYKRATILRRIERRMQVTVMPNLPAYRDYLRDHEQEATSLLGDLLIGVTNFFRDRAAFDALEREVVPRLFDGKTTGDVIRVWVAGCASGEEAYSITMLLLEQAARMPHPPAIQVFATDIDEHAIQVAREGSYPQSIATDVAPARLRQFFTQEPGGYRINGEVRERVLFAAHNLIKDPPFGHVDLVTCRNLLIYLNREAQEQVFSLFHFALRPGGFLFLGSSEALDGASDLFAPINTKHRVFRANSVERSARVVPGLPLEAPPLRQRARNDATTAERRRIAFAELHQRMLEQYAPPSIIVNVGNEIVHLSEHAGRFIQLRGGEPSLNLLNVVLPELREELRIALFQAFRSGKATEARRVQLARDEQTSYVNMIVRPQRDPATQADWALVLFVEVDNILGTEGTPAETGAPEPVARHLQAETQRLKAQLQTTVEQYETGVEGLKASNEELQATNEELRSSTEELETSKEELQSVNEDLRTVNDQLKHTVDDVSAANDDLLNLIASTDIATIFLDRSLRIKRYTPRALDLFNLLPSDQGRPLADIAHKLDDADLLADAEQVLHSLQPVEHEVHGGADQHYLVRVVPYRATGDRIDGVVLTFVDITQRKQAAEALRESEAKYKELFNSIDEGFAVNEMLFDEAGNAVDYRVLETNPAHEKMTGLRESIGKTARELVPNFETHWIETFGNVAKTGEPVRMENWVEGLNRWFDVHAFRVGDGESHKVAVVFNDITERKQMEIELRESEARFRNMADNAPVMVWVTDADAHCTYLNTAWYTFTGQTPETGLGLGWLDATHPDERAHSEQVFLDANARRAPFRLEYRLRGSDGKYRWAIDSAVPRFAATGEFLGYIGSVLDIQKRKRAEEAVRESEERLRALLAKGADMITVSDRDGRIMYASPSTERVAGYTADEFIGSNPFADAIHPDDVGRCRDALERLFTTPGQSITLEHRARHKDGTWHWFEGTFTSLFHDPAVGGLVANVRDVSERKAAAEELARLYAAEQAARVDAEAALHTRNQFLSIASHELRTPLTSLIGYTYMLRTAAERGNGNVEKMTERITRQAERLNGLIDQLLDVSRLQRGQFAIERRPVDLAVLVAQVADDVRATLPPGAAHTIELMRPDAPIMLNGDAQRLDQVLQNLLSNAVEYSPEGGSVQVRLMHTETEAILEVADWGIGIPADAQARLFEPFYRAPNIGTQASGFGLGLHIAREIVERHGGHIAVQSAEGQGSTFRIVLPLQFGQNVGAQGVAPEPC